jgi:hypothetical protein
VAWRSLSFLLTFFLKLEERVPLTRCSSLRIRFEVLLFKLGPTDSVENFGGFGAGSLFAGRRRRGTIGSWGWFWVFVIVGEPGGFIVLVVLGPLSIFRCDGIGLMLVSDLDFGNFDTEAEGVGRGSTRRGEEARLGFGFASS